MEKDVRIGIALLSFAVLLLAITYAVNAFDLFRFLDKPFIGKGIGPLCSSLQECQEFCQSSMGRCIDFCNANPSSSMCNLLVLNRGAKNETSQ